MNRRRQLLFELTDNPRSSRAASFYGFVIEFGSLLSSIMLVARTLDGAIHGGVNPQFPSLDEALFFQTDFLFTALFSFDFLLRLVVCPSLWHMNPSDEEPVQPFLRDFYNWFDFVSVLPFYIEQTLGESKAVPLLRMLRMLRILKMTRVRINTRRELFWVVIFTILVAFFRDSCSVQGNKTKSSTIKDCVCVSWNYWTVLWLVDLSPGSVSR